MDEEISMHERGPAAWMVTFADLVILMLTFFVLLFSMTSMKTETWEAVSAAFSRTLQVDPAQPVNERSVEHTITARPAPIAMNLNYLAAVLDETLASDPLLGRGRLAMGGDRLVLALPADTIFVNSDGNEVALTEAGRGPRWRSWGESWRACAIVSRSLGTPRQQRKGRGQQRERSAMCRGGNYPWLAPPLSPMPWPMRALIVRQ